jgi:hypothetical protein
MTDFAVLNVSARLDDFEPVHVSDSFARVRNRCADRFFDTRFGRTDDFKYFVDVVFHFSSLKKAARRSGPLLS